MLESVYEIGRDEILESVSDLLLMPILKFEKQSALQQFVYADQSNKYDLSDLLIAHSAKENGCVKIITFDNKASEYDLFELAQ